MILIDVNVLVYAYRENSPDHPAFRHWLLDLVQSEAPFGVAPLILSGFLRITTHPKIFTRWRLTASEAKKGWLFV